MFFRSPGISNVMCIFSETYMIKFLSVCISLLRTWCGIHFIRQSLEIPNWYSEAVNRWRTDNAIVKRKGTNKQTAIHKTLHRTLKIENINLKKRGLVLTLSNGKQFLLHYWHPLSKYFSSAFIYHIKKKLSMNLLQTHENKIEQSIVIIQPQHHKHDKKGNISWGNRGIAAPC